MSTLPKLYAPAWTIDHIIRKTGCKRYMYQIYLHQIFAPDICTRYLYQIFAPDISTRYLHQIYAPDIYAPDIYTDLNKSDNYCVPPPILYQNTFPPQLWQSRQDWLKAEPICLLLEILLIYWLIDCLVVWLFPYWLIEGRADMSVAGTDQRLLFDWLFDCLITDWLKEEPIWPIL